MRIESLGGVEAEGFGVGVHDQEPTPALRATPPGRGFSDGQRFTCKIRVETPASGWLEASPMACGHDCGRDVSASREIVGREKKVPNARLVYTGPNRNPG